MGSQSLFPKASGTLSGRLVLEAKRVFPAPNSDMQTAHYQRPQAKLEAHANRLSTTTGWLAAAMVGGILAVAGSAKAAETNWLSSLDLGPVVQSWGSPRANRSVDNHELSLGGKTYAHGVGTHAESRVRLLLKGNGERFVAKVGVDDETQQRGTVVFQVLGDNKTLWESGKLTGGAKPVDCSVDVTGVKELLLLVTDAGDGIDHDHADWVEAQIVMRTGKPEVLPGLPPEPAVVLTPPVSKSPRINGAKVFGVRPGSPFLFTVAATGERPMRFSAKGLPAGLQLEETSGRITGQLQTPGEYVVTVRAQNRLGHAERKLKLVCGPHIGLTPALGWNSWNCFASAVTADKIKAAADAMVSSGLADHGWTYINIDDYWQVHRDSKDPTLQGPQRDAQGRILPNPRFPDMKGLADYVHAKGLKIGLYSSPGPWTCGGCVGSFDYERLDARQYAAWGFDYLKYDWCSYNRGLEGERSGDSAACLAQITNRLASLPKERADLMRPYALMQVALAEQSRDILYSLCQYGMGNVWEWCAQVEGNSCRTTGDITDSWGSMSGIGFGQAGHEKFNGPGHFGDPDMLVVGRVGWGPSLHPTHLTPNEQYTHISLWCLLSSPLLIGCDMTQMDAFTLGLLSNDEVLEVDQDPLGKQAARVSANGHLEVWAKELEDGSRAVGLFNRGEEVAKVEVQWSTLGLKGKHAVRDLWRQKNLGRFADGFSASVPRHGVVLIRVQR
jgi:alpha-galactosidase